MRLQNGAINTRAVQRLSVIHECVHQTLPVENTATNARQKPYSTCLASLISTLAQHIMPVPSQVQAA
jgi:hypothetical protein